MASPSNFSTNGISHEQGQSTSSVDLSQLVGALDAIYDPRSSNEVRQAASSFLEDAKRHPQALSYGHAIARDRSHSPTLRHYGLSMLEFSIKYTWESYTKEHQTALRQSVIELGFDVNDQDPPYIRNKVAQLWAELAKRSWAIDWMDMDELLVRLWGTSIVHQGLVLYVLETLCEDTFNREDPTIVQRGTDLGQACVEIFTPASILLEMFPKRDTDHDLRYGSEGWLQRINDLLGQCLQNDPLSNDQARSTAIKCLSTLRATFGWVMFRAICEVHAVNHLQSALAVPEPGIQTVALDCMISVFGKAGIRDEDFKSLAPPMFSSDSINLLKNVFEFSQANIDDLDEAKYTVNKKLTELLSYLGSFLEQRLHLISNAFDLQAYFNLLFSVMHNPSLLVTIPVLHVWTKFLRSRLIRDSPAIANLIGGLLEICSRRLVRFENFPEDSADPTFRFLNEDIDTIPERHAFLGNYRRYCMEVVEVIVRKLPTDAINHILQQAMELFQNVANEQHQFQPQSFSKNAPSVLRVDAQITVIDAAVRGYLKWLASHANTPAPQNEQDRTTLQDTFEQCGRALMALQFKDPEIRRKIMQLLVTFSTRPLDDRPSFASSVLQCLLEAAMNPEDDTRFQMYSEAVKMLQTQSMQELSKLGMTFPDHFLSMYDEITASVEKRSSEGVLDERQRAGFEAFLFIIIHRSTQLDRPSQELRLRSQLSSVKAVWQDAAFTQQLSNFGSFCELLGFGQLVNYITSHQFQKVPEWSEQQLDDEGKALQALILDRSHHLPMRLTKTFLAASTEKVESGTPQWQIACVLWADLIPVVLPNLLQLISHAQAFNNLQSWSLLPDEMQQVVRRMLTDRFWQAGISTESRDDFFARVSNSKTTYEGFASTVRGAVRQIRETGYWIIYGLIRFGDFFYGIQDLAGPLSEALFANTNTLSAHHFSILLNMSVQLIEQCPPHLRAQFLPQIVSGLFIQLDRKISGEWEAVRARNEQAANGDNLSDEMKTESILRQLTYTAVSLACSLLDSHRPGQVPKVKLARLFVNDSAEGIEKPQETSGGTPARSPGAARMHTFILSTPSVLEPLLMFLKNALRFRDTRSCNLAIRTLRSTIPLLPLRDPQSGPLVRHFLTDDLLKTAITSLHEPYFIDSQKDLASLIAHILLISPESAEEEDTARAVLLSLPGLVDRPDKVDGILGKLRQGGGAHGPQMSDRHVRAIVLGLLSEVRGQSIHEMGRIVPDKAPGDPESGPKPRKERSKMQEQYMSVDESASAGGIGQGGEESLAGVADMFADGG
ncbi:ARM repeat-containing protein [Rhizodiscina lignyota]|uniref:ARM repeat-containing protein n=1 Tax=Rhizodiscina lignyota TaxID=1504668 RepID=A0A9P4ICD9_9PEZI|nr:ARM repeat-containing protein [Rhizodiscina lignyota]